MLCNTSVVLSHAFFWLVDQHLLMTLFPKICWVLQIQSEEPNIDVLPRSTYLRNRTVGANMGRSQSWFHKPAKKTNLDLNHFLLNLLNRFPPLDKFIQHYIQFNLELQL